MADTRTNAELEAWRLHCLVMLSKQLSHVERKHYSSQHQKAVDELRRRKYDFDLMDEATNSSDLLYRMWRTNRGND